MEESGGVCFRKRWKVKVGIWRATKAGLPSHTIWTSAGARGHPVETGLCIASTDPLAADAAGAFLLGFRAQAVRHLWEAAKLKLGGSDVDEFEYPALNIKKAFSIFTKAAYGKAIDPEHA